MNRLSKAILLLSFKRQFWVSFYIRLSWLKIYLCSHYDFSWCAPYRLMLCLFSSFILSFFADLLLRLNFVCQRIDACATKTVFRLIAIEFVYDTHTLHPIQYQFFINGLWLKIYLKLLLTSIRLIFFSLAFSSFAPCVAAKMNAIKRSRHSMSSVRRPSIEQR